MEISEISACERERAPPTRPNGKAVIAAPRLAVCFLVRLLPPSRPGFPLRGLSRRSPLLASPPVLLLTSPPSRAPLMAPPLILP